MADKRDYYDVLGIDRSADEAQIKKAYRQAAKKHHPDVNAGDPGAEARFKEANEAYEVLSDQQKRSRYDQFGHAGVDPSYGAGGGGNPYGGGFGGFEGDFGDIGDIFSSFFGGGFGGQSRQNPNGPRRGTDTSTTITLSFEEAAKGCTKKVNLTNIKTCSECNGSGAEKGTSPKTCSSCKGAGQVKVSQRTPFGNIQTSRVCDQCSGTGKQIEKPCHTCSGKGRVRDTHEQELNIPAGIDEGQVLQVRGQGDAGANGGPSGDLHININIRPHPIFVRSGYDVHCDVPITFSQAALGADITVPTLDGKVKFTVHEGTQPGDEFKLKGKGIQRLQSSGKGDQYVKIIIEVPKNLNDKQKTILKDFEAATGDGNYKKRRSFFDKFKVLFGEEV